jgi:hypothetical protein
MNGCWLILKDANEWYAVDEVGGSKQVACFEWEELVEGAVVNSQALHPGLGLLLGIEETCASTAS